MAMQFQVPQFIERESKVVGPFTLKQTMYFGTPLVIGFILYFLLPLVIVIVATVAFEAFGIMLTVVKPGGKALPEVLWNAVGYSMRPRTFIWRKGNMPFVLHKGKEYINPLEEEPPEVAQIAHRSKLNRLSLQVKTKK